MELSDSLRLAFPSLPSMDHPVFIPSRNDLDPYWVVGFTNGMVLFLYASLHKGWVSF